MSDRDILEQAQAKLNAKQYREARYLLQQIPDHPTALKWITKIDDILARQASEPAPPNPSSTFNLSKPLPDLDEIRPAAKTAPSSQNGMVYTIVRAAFGFVVAIALLYALGSQQANPIDSLLSIFRPLQTYQDSRISLSHSSGWNLTELTDHGWCRGVNWECHYFIKHTPNVGLLVTYAPQNNRRTAAQFAEASWESEVGDPVFIIADRRTQELTLAGMPAVAQMYTQTEKDENGGEFYMIDIYVTDGLDAYVINVFANTACNLQRRIADVNAVLSTLQVVSESSAGAYSAASPVALTVPACAG